MVTVEKKDENTFEVTVEDEQGTSHHTVTVDDDYHQRLTEGKIPKELLVKRSFNFLLERESKESILSEFDLTVISEYFSEYEDKVGV